MKKLPRSRNMYRMGLLETFCIIATDEYKVATYLTDKALVFNNRSYLFKVER